MIVEAPLIEEAERESQPIGTGFTEFAQSIADDLADEHQHQGATRVDVLVMSTIGARGIRPELVTALEFECALRGIDWSDILAAATRKALWPGTSN